MSEIEEEHRNIWARENPTGERQTQAEKSDGFSAFFAGFAAEHIPVVKLFWLPSMGTLPECLGAGSLLGGPVRL